MTSAEVQSLLLKILARGGDTRLGRGQYYFHEAVRNVEPTLGCQPVMEAVWALIGQGLAYIDYSQSPAENWVLDLTEAGLAAARDEEATPDDPGGYLRRLRSDVPGMSATVRAYAEEALGAYNARLYRSSAVMLGVASEAAILEAATSFASEMPEAESKQFLKTVNSRKQNFITKFAMFQDKLRSKKNELPDELADGLELTVHAVADLLRVSRNDAGHPTGRPVGRDDAFVHLRMFVRYARKLYALKSHFEGAKPSLALHPTAAAERGR